MPVRSTVGAVPVANVLRHRDRRERSPGLMEISPFGRDDNDYLRFAAEAAPTLLLKGYRDEVLGSPGDTRLCHQGSFTA